MPAKERFDQAMVPSVDRALKCLELLRLTATGMTLSSISRKLCIPRSSAYYLLRTLAKHNFVQCNGDRRAYSLGGCEKSARLEADLKRICFPHLQFFSRTVGMAAQVGVRERAEARIIDCLDVAGPKLDSWVGRHFDLHCTAIGKSLISRLDDVELENLFRSHSPPKHNSNTVTSLERLKLQLAQTRRRGFSLDDEEHALGIRCVASPIFNYAGGVIGALGVFSSAGRLSSQGMLNVGSELAVAAHDISRSLKDCLAGQFTEEFKRANEPAATI